MDLYTIGYEGLSLSSFIGYLRNHSVMTVVDIREKPISRKKGFSKNDLQKGLASNQIDYLHVQALGTPKYLREELNKKKNYFRFFRRYNNFLNTRANYVDTIIDKMLHETVALVCFERDARKCHRSAVAQKIKKKSPWPIVIHHIKII
jgi:uncharacterized protein (DUF488 family)